MGNLDKGARGVAVRLAAVLGLLLSLLLSTRGQEATGRVRIGVLARRAPEQCLANWTPMGEYLSSEVPGHRFEIVPLQYDEVRDCVKGRAVDFLLANPAFYVELEATSGASRILTLKNLRTGRAQTVFGGVIFARKDRTDILQLGDLKGKTFMATDESSLGGWLAVWRELLDAGIKPRRDLANLQFAHSHDTVVQAVRNREVDAGSVRTGTLEGLAPEGRIRMEEFRVVPRRAETENGGFPFQVSTRLYPEWPLAKLRHTPSDLADKVVVALLRMPPGADAAQQGQYVGWTAPLHYQPVHECMKALRIGPYKRYGEASFSDVLRQHGWWLVLLFLGLVLAIGVLLHVAGLNRRLKDTTRALEMELAERARVEDKMRRRHAKLSQVSRLHAIEEMASGLAHELNQPLCSIVSCAQGCIQMMKSNRGKQEEILDAIEEVGRQAERAGDVMWRLNRLFRKHDLHVSNVSLAALIRETAEFLEPELNRRGIGLRLDLQGEDLHAFVDPTQIEQVLLNLSYNAIEAMETARREPRRLTIQARLSDPAAVDVSVADTGPGLLPENADRIFDPFFTTKANAAGIGLSISRSIVEAHGGRLWAVAGPAEGALFHFTLPTRETGRKG